MPSTCRQGEANIHKKCASATATTPFILPGSTGRAAALLGGMVTKAFLRAFVSGVLTPNCSLEHMSHFFFSLTCNIWKFPGQGLNLHHSSNPSCCSDSIRSLTHCPTRQLHESLFLNTHAQAPSHSTNSDSKSRGWDSWKGYFLWGFGVFFVFVFVFCFLGPCAWHTEVPRLGAEMELQLPGSGWQDPSCVCNLHHSSQQRRILNSLSEARN